MSNSAPTSKRRSLAFPASAVLWFLLYVVARALLERSDLSGPARVAAALVPVPAFIVFLVLFIRGIRSMDELERRVQLEALAVAFPLTFILLMTLGLLELAVPLNRNDWSYRHVWAMLPTFYLLGIVFARRRYS